jgi:small subunit ribosomal protein S20
VRNKSVRTELKTQAKNVRTAASSGQADTGDLFREAARNLDKAASKGAVHKRAAARRKSRLARQVNAGTAS